MTQFQIDMSVAEFHQGRTHTRFMAAEGCWMNSEEAWEAFAWEQPTAAASDAWETHEASWKSEWDNLCAADLTDGAVAS